VTQRSTADFASTYRANHRTIEASYSQPKASSPRGLLILLAAVIAILGAGGGWFLMNGASSPGIDSTITGAIDPAIEGMAQFEGL
jgi:hypothetical protein